MLEVGTLCGAFGGVLVLAYYSLNKYEKDLVNKEKDKLMRLEPSERLKYLKEGAKETSSTSYPYLSSALRIVARKTLDDNEYLEVLKIFFPELSSFEEWKRRCTSNILNRYNFKGQY